MEQFQVKTKGNRAILILKVLHTFTITNNVHVKTIVPLLYALHFPSEYKTFFKTKKAAPTAML